MVFGTRDRRSDHAVAPRRELLAAPAAAEVELVDPKRARVRDLALQLGPERATVAAHGALDPERHLRGRRQDIAERGAELLLGEGRATRGGEQRRRRDLQLAQARELHDLPVKCRRGRIDVARRADRRRRERVLPAREVEVALGWATGREGPAIEL